MVLFRVLPTAVLEEAHSRAVGVCCRWGQVFSQFSPVPHGRALLRSAAQYCSDICRHVGGGWARFVSWFPAIAPVSLRYVSALRRNWLLQLEGIYLNAERLASGLQSAIPAAKPPPSCIDGRTMVFIGKRRLHLGQSLTALSPHLKRIGAEHIGVELFVFPPDAAGRPRRIVFDFVPRNGGDFSKFDGVVKSKIQRNRLCSEEWAFVGTTNRSMRQIESFNARYVQSKDYHLGRSDCRDYASAFVRFLTDEDIHPGCLAKYVNTSVAARGLLSVEVTGNRLVVTGAEGSRSHELGSGKRGRIPALQRWDRLGQLELRQFGG